METPAWFVYILHCNDASLYTGITTDLERRVLEHNDTDKGARYTRARRPVYLAWFDTAPDRSLASKREASLKALSTTDKHRLIREQQPRCEDDFNRLYPGSK